MSYNVYRDEWNIMQCDDIPYIYSNNNISLFSVFFVHSKWTNKTIQVEETENVGIDSHIWQFILAMKLTLKYLRQLNKHSTII